MYICYITFVQVEDTCLVALATAYNARETEGGTSKQELFHFIEKVSFAYVYTETYSCMRRTWCSINMYILYCIL